MSRTYRRKSVNPPTWYTHEYISMNGGTHSVPVRYEGKARKKKLAEFHGDNGYGYRDNAPLFFRNHRQKVYRATSRLEIGKYFKNEEYEVMITANPHLPYWD